MIFAFTSSHGSFLFRSYCTVPTDKVFSLDPRGNDTKAAGLYMVGYTRGYYGKTGDLPARMLADANERGLAFCSPVYCFYLHDELSEDDPDDYLLKSQSLSRKPGT